MTRTILLVEDHDELREAMHEMLVTADYEVLSAADAETGLALWQARVNDVALVISDLELPGIDGLELIDRVRRDRPLQALVVSSHSDRLDLMRRARAGDVGFLRKPFAAAALVAEAGRLLALGEWTGSAAKMPGVVPLDEEPAAPPVMAAAGQRRGWLAPAAAAVLALAVGALWLLQGPAPPELPARGGETVMRGARLTAISPLGDIFEVPTQLTWESVDGATRYRVELLAVDDQPLWSTTTTETLAQLPPDLLSVAVAYHWRVEAFAGEAPIARASELRFRILPRREPDNRG